jgi:hypothetical protein
MSLTHELPLRLVAVSAACQGMRNKSTTEAYIAAILILALSALLVYSLRKVKHAFVYQSILGFIGIMLAAYVAISMSLVICFDEYQF